MHWQTVRAFAVAPLVPAGIFAAVAVTLGVIQGGLGFASTALLASPIWLALALPVTYALAAMLGIPTYFLLRHFHCLSASALTFSGALLGLIAGVVLGSTTWPSSATDATIAALFFGFEGGACGYAFWRLTSPEHNAKSVQSIAP